MSEIGEQTIRESVPLVRLRFAPLWSYVDAVREFCGAVAQATFESHVLEQRIAIVVHELIENAIRYGDGAWLELCFEKLGERMAISVTNAATEEQAERLAEVLSRMSSTDPEQSFCEAVRRSVEQPNGAGGLGLPRVRHEGRVELALERSLGCVRITALGAV